MLRQSVCRLPTQPARSSGSVAVAQAYEREPSWTSDEAACQAVVACGANVAAGRKSPDVVGGAVMPSFFIRLRSVLG